MAKPKKVSGESRKNLAELRLLSNARSFELLHGIRMKSVRTLLISFQTKTLHGNCTLSSLIEDLIK